MQVNSVLRIIISVPEQLLLFLDDIDIPLSMLNSELLCLYEKWLGKRRVKKNSSSFYMRILRAAYNKAVKERLVVSELFLSVKYTLVSQRQRNVP